MILFLFFVDDEIVAVLKPHDQESKKKQGPPLLFTYTDVAAMLAILKEKARLAGGAQSTTKKKGNMQKQINVQTLEINTRRANLPRIYPKIILLFLNALWHEGGGERFNARRKGGTSRMHHRPIV